MRYFWFLSIYSVRPDGGTQMVLEHHKHLLRNNKLSFIVSQNKILWSDPALNCITMWDAMRSIKRDDILISSWDDHILGTFKMCKLGRKIAYLQSHFANHPLSYKTSFLTITVSEFAKDYIKKNYDKDRIVLPNVVKIPRVIKPIRFLDKIDLIMTACPRRDVDVLQYLINNNPGINVKIYLWANRKTFLNNVNRHKYYLSFYRLDAFGLPPILAMRLGTIPLIVTKSTGRDYVNALNCIYYDTDDYMKSNEHIDFNKWSNGIGINMSKCGIKTAKKYERSKILEVIK